LTPFSPGCVNVLITDIGLQWVSVLLAPLFSHVVHYNPTSSFFQMNIFPPNEHHVWRVP
jgi:hypothetical protein